MLRFLAGSTKQAGWTDHFWVRDLTQRIHMQNQAQSPRELFTAFRRTYAQSLAMKSLLTSRTELRWFAVAVPSVFLAHWMFTALCPRLMAMLPYSLRAVLHLL